MKTMCIFLIFIISAEITLSSTAYNYTGYAAKYTNQSINSTYTNLQQNDDDSSVLLYVNYRGEDYSSEFNIDDVIIMKAGKSSSLEDSLSYCINSAILDSGYEITLNRAQVTTGDEGAIALCSTNGGRINARSSNISTLTKNSIAMHASEGSYISGRDSIISTIGENSPAMSGQKRSFMSCYNCQISTTKKGSPLIQTFGGFEIHDSYGRAEKSPLIITDRTTRIDIDNTTLNCTWDESGDDVYGILLKNTSFNPDKDRKEYTTFELRGSSLEIKSETAPMILVDGAYISFDFSNCKIKSKIFLKLRNAEFKTNIIFKNCDIEGDIIADEKASLTIDLTNTKFKGAINPDDKAGYVRLTMNKNSNITLTGNSNIDSFDNLDQTNSNIIKNSFSMSGLEEDSSSNLLFSKIMILLFAFLLI